MTQNSSGSEIVRLKSGDDMRRDVVNAVMEKLTLLKDEVEIFYNLVTSCRVLDRTVSATEDVAVLVSMGLIEGQDKYGILIISDAVRSVVLSGVEGKYFEMSLVSPIAGE